MQYTSKNKLQEQLIGWKLGFIQRELNEKIRNYHLQGDKSPEELVKSIMELAKHRAKEGEYDLLGMAGEQKEIQNLVQETRRKYQSQKRQMRKQKEEKLNSNHNNSMNKRLMTLLIISRYYSTGLKFLEIPGEVSDHYTVDIQDFKIGREQKPKIDRRQKKNKEGEER